MAVAVVLDGRLGRQARRAALRAAEFYAALETERTRHCGFDPLAADLPTEAHWALLADGTDPESALVTMTVVDPREKLHHEHIDVSHDARMQTIAEWAGRAHADAPECLPPAMRAEPAQMRH